MKTQIKINGMHCESCALLIKEILEELEGVKNAKVSFEKSSATVEFNEMKVTEKDIKSLIEKEGYKIKV